LRGRFAKDFKASLAPTQLQLSGSLGNYTDCISRSSDGDFFVHFLDSPEQALLVIPLWSDIVPKGGGTVICADGIKPIAKHLVSRRKTLRSKFEKVN
jgi:hypothetical protein